VFNTHAEFTTPRSFGAALSGAFSECGYPLATTTASRSRTPWLLEVYPHPALISLLKRPRRIPYKVSKSCSYWPTLTLVQRVEKLLIDFAAINAALLSRFSEIVLPLPARGSIQKLAHLKKFEDALDALICAWVGVEFLAGGAVALGDGAAAIWCPSDVVLSYCNQFG
jgi:predicted RNase H-like nuclease